MEDRRTVLCGLAAATATSLGGQLARAAIIPADDKRLHTANIRWTIPAGRVLHGFMALPAKARGRQPAVVVLHDRDRLTEHIRDVTRRVALAGYIACAPDLLRSSVQASATPVLPADPGTQALADASGTVRWLAGQRYGTGKVAALGFGSGGALAMLLAMAPELRLAGAVAYDDASEAPAVTRPIAPLLLHRADNQPAVNADPSTARGTAVELFHYSGVAPGFDDETDPGRYDAAAATLAWARTVAFLKEHLR